MAGPLPAPLHGARQPFVHGRQVLHLGDCMEWLASAAPASVAAVVTDPPYGLVEFNEANQRKLRAGRGGVWRIPPSFDNARRKPLPRFTVLHATERRAIEEFFAAWGAALLPVLLPGAHVVIAGNPLVSPLVAAGMERAGFERRGEIVRLVRTFRGGDRPKGAEAEFAEVSSMPRGGWEPWGLYRRPLGAATLAANLRRYGVGGLRRPSVDVPFSDVVRSGIAPAAERAVAPHPNVKPQAFLRTVVRAVLPRGDGVVLDPFAGCGTTLAACEALGVDGIGVEIDPHYFDMATHAIAELARM